jgi:hypothetical protein
MSKEELIDKMVTAVMEDFDFDRVHRVMVNLDWKWGIGDGEMTVPSSYRLAKEAEGLLRNAAQHYGGKESHSCGSGGFMAHLDGESLTLQFILTEMTSYAIDFINIDEPDQKADIKAKRIEDCNLSVRTTNICKNVGIDTLGDLCKLHKTDWLKFRNGGKKSLAEIDDLLHDNGLDWAE